MTVANPAATPTVRSRPRPRLSALIQDENAPLFLLGGFKLVIHLATNGIYGYHRDELYYLAAGRHPAFGYVDFPPITPLLSRVDVALFGNSPWALRLFPALAGALVVVLAGIIAREFGGGRRAQILASLAALACPMLLGANWLFQTVTFDQLMWMLTLLFAVRAIRRDDPRLWVLVGIAAGVGLETKLTIVALGVGLAVALACTPARRHLRTPWPWLGGAIALAIFAPNLVWQATHGWATLDYTRNHSGSIQDDGGPLAFLSNQLLIIGLLALPLWLLGWYHLFRERDLRPIGVAAAVAFLIFLPGGKYYYPGPLIPVVLAAGCVRLETLAGDRPRWRRAMPIAGVAVVLSAAAMAIILIPLVPTSSMASLGLDGIRKDYADTAGWPQLAHQVEGVYASLPPEQRGNAAVLALNYGEAGALQRYGHGLPPVLSTELTYFYWKPRAIAPATVITIGYEPSDMAPYFGACTQMATIPSTDGIDNEEVGDPILVCRQPIVPFDVVWQRLKNFS